ncbi:hypothetical protein ZIOFF_007383 [Zingiber officinale]|uniref:Uncharacterized protein n=1 Tax=Zingiber officinale TaxID=94328 RepID=A0A8J5HQ09_ZINOF|nr:hypothetical protein ZIOFF_007383 [Zingiber officinale]
MASEDVVGKSTGESAVNTIVNLAEEAKLAREGVKAPGHAILSICKSLVAGGVAGGVTVSVSDSIGKDQELLLLHWNG